jgi:hypothetical protein
VSIPPQHAPSNLGQHSRTRRTRLNQVRTTTSKTLIPDHETSTKCNRQRFLNNLNHTDTIGFPIFISPFYQIAPTSMTRPWLVINSTPPKNNASETPVLLERAKRLLAVPPTNDEVLAKPRFVSRGWLFGRKGNSMGART